MSDQIQPQAPPPDPEMDTAGNKAIVWILLVALGFLALVVGGLFWGATFSGSTRGPKLFKKSPRLKMQSLSNLRQITLGVRVYAAENDGRFPSDNNGEPFLSSQDAFNVLMPDYIDAESVFWVYSAEPNHQSPPDDNGVLERGECVYGYAAGLTDSSHSHSPLVFEGFLTDDLSCTEYMMHLRQQHAIVGFVDGHVEAMPLTSRSPGATITSKDRTIKNILLPRSEGGSLDTKKENVLLPIGY